MRGLAEIKKMNDDAVKKEQMDCDELKSMVLNALEKYAEAYEHAKYGYDVDMDEINDMVFDAFKEYKRCI